MATGATSPTGENRRGATAAARVTLRGQEYEFRFPDNVYMRNVVAGIFQGNEYPLITLPGYTPSTIVDLGANVGAAALYFHNAYPAATIWCYEPSQENFACLQANAQPFAANIQVFPYGLLDRDCELPMYHGTSQSGQNSVIQNSETSPAAAEVVRLVRAGREAAERGWQHLSILKIDTEGCEVPILTELLAAVPSIDFLYCEYHAEQNRRTIDTMVEERFVLGGSKSDKPHQGMCIYWSRDLLARYPMVDALQKSIRGKT